MGLTLDSSSVLGRVAGAFTEGADTAQVIIQVGAAAGAIALAYIVARAVCGRVPPNRLWVFGKGDFERVVFPVFAVAFVWAARHALARVTDTDTGPMEMILSLLVVFAIIRFAAYVLGHVIPDGGFQRIVIRTVTAIAWTAVLLHIVGALPDVLNKLDSHGIAIGKGKTEITLLDLVKGLAGLFFTIVGALWLSRITEGRVMAAESMEMTTRLVISKVIRIVAVFIAVFVALPLAGIDVTTLSVLTGAVGVGLGFGLQKIVANYVSGFIVLFDRSLRIGDVIAIGGKRGEVKSIDTRYTVLKGSDGVESIIPNEKLITDQVDHHTYSDPKVSVVIGVSVPYEADVDRACELLNQVAHKHVRVIEEPPAAARLKQFSDHGVDLELTVWIKDPEVGDADLKSEMLRDILRAFKDAGIALAYPRREVRVIATPEMAKSPAQSTG